MNLIQDRISKLSVDEINAVIENNLRGAIKWTRPKDVNCLTAGAAVVIPHDLGTIPSDIAIEPLIDGNGWADLSDRKLWTKDIMVFHVSNVGQYRVKAGVQR